MEFSKNELVKFALFISVAWLFFGAIRFFFAQPEYTHYHADFAVFINGERQQFDNFSYYEEVTQCSASGNEATPQGRAHMHDNVNSIVHVHDELVTWGHFFANLDWGLTDRSITTWNETYTTDQDRSVTFVLNGEIVDALANQVINDQDIAVIYHGEDEQNALRVYEEFASSPQAQTFNQEQDPAACSGSEDSFSTKLKRAFLFTKK